jgi:NAD(P)-dependent dehydrogenase (short-subunit alcohol dehydrogenase family)
MALDPIGNPIQLDGRVVIVTGGARGLGRAMALALVRAGASVLIVARSKEQIEATVQYASQLRSEGLCRGIVGDVSLIEDCTRIIASAEQFFGSVDVLVNNAAIGPYSENNIQSVNEPLPFWEVDAETLASMVHINLMGPFNLFRAALPGMLQKGFGKIVNISTSRPTMRRPNSGPYGPLKAALEAATYIWAKELEGTGVTANVLSPGGLSDTSFVPGGNVGQRAQPFRAGKGPLGQEGKSMDFLPAEIMGPPMLWLASDQSNGVNGRRFIARDWDPDLPFAEAAPRAMQEPSEMPIIM